MGKVQDTKRQEKQRIANIWEKQRISTDVESTGYQQMGKSTWYQKMGTEKIQKIWEKQKKSTDGKSKRCQKMGKWKQPKRWETRRQQVTFALSSSLAHNIRVDNIMGQQRNGAGGFSYKSFIERKKYHL